MSHSSLHRIYRTKATPFATFRNSHGTGPALWSHLLETYLNRGQFSWKTNDPELFGLADDKRVPKHLRICLLFTCDYAVCRVEDIDTLSRYCLSTGAATKRPGRVNHWDEIGRVLDTHKRRARQIGVGLGCTSVSNPWEDGDRKPWDIFTREYLE